MESYLVLRCREYLRCYRIWFSLFYKGLKEFCGGFCVFEVKDGFEINCGSFWDFLNMSFYNFICLCLY